MLSKAELSVAFRRQPAEIAGKRQCLVLLAKFFTSRENGMKTK